MWKLLARETRKGWVPKDVAVKLWKMGKVLGLEKIWDSVRIRLHRVNEYEEPSMTSSFESFCN